MTSLYLAATPMACLLCYVLGKRAERRATQRAQEARLRATIDRITREIFAPHPLRHRVERFDSIDDLLRASREVPE